MTFSFEVRRVDFASWPPFVDGCPVCPTFDGGLVPYATNTVGSELTAFYRHRRCGHQWSCRWSAQWDGRWAA
jgi:hypothetical protein